MITLRTMVCEDVVRHVILPFVDSWKVLGKVTRVCKMWRGLVEVEKSARVREYAFGKEKWKEYFGCEVKKIPFPKDIWNILTRPCPFFPGKMVKDTHMLQLIPVTVNGEKLSLNKLGNLVKALPEDKKTKCSFYPKIKELYGDKTTNKSYWAFMTTNVIPNSRNKSYSKQQKLVNKHRNYDVPNALEAAVCIVTKFVASGIRLYGQKPWTYIRCQEKVQDYHIVVGGFGPAGLNVNSDGAVDFGTRGVGALRKFF